MFTFRNKPFPNTCALLDMHSTLGISFCRAETESLLPKGTRWGTLPCIRLRRVAKYPALRSAATKRRCAIISTAVKVTRLSEEAAMAAASQAGWQASRVLLETRVGLAKTEADFVISEAFGWGSQAYWRQQKVKHPPNVEQVEQVLDLLCRLGIAESELGKVVGSFPQVLGCKLDLLENNVDLLRTKWFLKGRVLAGTIVRKPAVLGSTVDCEGSCIAECNRCWARF